MNNSLREQTKSPGSVQRWGVDFDQELLLATLEHAKLRALLTGQAVLASFTQPVEPCDALLVFRVLAQLGLGERFFWEKPDDQRAFAGVGAALTLETSGRYACRQAAATWRMLLRHSVSGFTPGKLPSHVTGPLLFGGFAFDPLRPRTGLWEGFPSGLLLLPRLLFSGAEKHAALTVNLLVRASDDCEEQARMLTATVQRLQALVEQSLAAPEAESATVPVESLIVRDSLPAETWRGLVASAVQQIRQGDYQKVVLARSVEVTRADGAAFEVADTLGRLRVSYPGAYTFAFQRDKRYFIGATPERLVFAQDALVQTMALAGSAPRGLTAEEDQQLGEELLESPKNRSEHALVVEMMRQALEGLCSTVTIAEEPSLLKLRNIQHLRTLINGELLPGHSILEALQILHPTPAVGGIPREPALREIRASEQLERGWYAGPLGWVDREGHGEFAVALRSGLIDGEKATLFAGCGIVADSDPQSEYAESCLKLQVLLRGLSGQE